MRRFAFIIIFFVLPLICGAQTNFDFNQYYKLQNVRLKLSLLDAKTKEPVCYATVYMIPHGDTTISHFALSNEKGRVEIKDILPGKYEIHVEIIGYKPYKKVHSLSGWEKNLGVIKLEENPEQIDASKITAIGNPIVIKKDTIEYNAAAFRVGENAMLEDLLRKMPGMKVDADGTVTVNGEKVEKITVGGKTFFFNDPAVAVKNLPAKIVEKIKIIDKTRSEASFTGISTKNDKEKVMDVLLKEEYRKGWFGNAGINGGVSIISKDDKKISGSPGALFNTNAMLSGYNEKDQLVFLGSGKNATSLRDRSVIFSPDFNNDADEFSSKPGLQTTAQAGANYNTERLKGFDSNISVNYNFNSKDSRENSLRTSFYSEGPEIITDGKYQGVGSDHKINTAMELSKKNNDKYLFTIRPTFYFTSRDRETESSSVTRAGGLEKNKGANYSLSGSKVIASRTSWSTGIKNIGKERRSLTFSGNYNLRKIKGNSVETGFTIHEGVSDLRHFIYENQDSRHAAEGVLSYVEPFGKNWSVQARLTGCYITNTNNRDAFNGEDGSRNILYSAFSKNNDILFRERLLIQYKTEKKTILAGFQLDEEENTTFSISRGVQKNTGKGEWVLNWSPYAEISLNGDHSRLRLEYGGNSDVPSGADIIPALNINDPVRIRFGNIYLRPQFSHSSYLRFRVNDPKRYSHLSLYMNFRLNTKQIVDASWFDKDGLRYAFPVNSPKPGANASLYASYNTPIDKNKLLSLSFNTYISYGKNIGYQAKTKLPGLDKDNFDYEKTMKLLWGNEDGDVFFNGSSGFAESRTERFSYSLDGDLNLNFENFRASAGASAVNTITKYSLNKAADMSVWNFNASADLLYRTSRKWELSTQLIYRHYKGYAQGYGKPELIWNASISKEIRSVTLSLKASDILNQTRGLERTNYAEYIQDVYRNTLGRFFLAGVTFNFGKQNAKQNRQAQKAMMQMIM